MNSNFAKATAVAGLVAAFAVSTAIPASATVTASEWGAWDSMFLGFAYDNPAFIGGTYSVTGADSWTNLYPATEGDGFTADTPLGGLFGSSTALAYPTVLKVYSPADNATPAIMEITFQTEVPANQLVLAITDVDVDHATITMYDGQSNSISATNIIGSAPTTGFNFVDPANTTNVPTSTATGPYSVLIGNAPDFTDGSTGWVRPSVGVKFIHIEFNTEDGASHFEKVWMGQLLEATPAAELGHTGVDQSVYLAAMAGGGILAAGGFIGLRRRN